MSMWERERGNTRYLSSRQQSTGVLCPAPGGYVQGAATPLPPRALGWALKSSLGADAGMSPWLLNAGAAEICISDHPVLQPATLQHWGQMRRRGKGWAPKMGLALLCFQNVTSFFSPQFYGNLDALDQFKQSICSLFICTSLCELHRAVYLHGWNVVRKLVCQEPDCFLKVIFIGLHFLFPETNVCHWVEGIFEDWWLLVNSGRSRSRHGCGSALCFE